jgi:hypothetical protein
VKEKMLCKPICCETSGFFIFGEKVKKSDEKSAKVKQKVVSLQRRFHK